MQGHLILIEGENEAQRIWSIPGEKDKSYTWVVKSVEVKDADGNGLAFLG